MNIADTFTFRNYERDFTRILTVINHIRKGFVTKLIIYL